MPTHYATLGLTAQKFSLPLLRKQYRLLALRWHPDRNLGNETAAAERFKEIQEAFDVLHDIDRRASYDREIMHDASRRAREWTSPRARPAPPRHGKPQPPPQKPPPQPSAGQWRQQYQEEREQWKKREQWEQSQRKETEEQWRSQKQRWKEQSSWWQQPQRPSWWSQMQAQLDQWHEQWHQWQQYQEAQQQWERRQRPRHESDDELPWWQRWWHEQQQKEEQRRKQAQRQRTEQWWQGRQVDDEMEQQAQRRAQQQQQRDEWRRQMEEERRRRQVDAEHQQRMQHEWQQQQKRQREAEEAAQGHPSRQGQLMNSSSRQGQLMGGPAARQLAYAGTPVTAAPKLLQAKLDDDEHPPEPTEPEPLWSDDDAETSDWVRAIERQARQAADDREQKEISEALKAVEQALCRVRRVTPPPGARREAPSAHHWAARRPCPCVGAHALVCARAIACSRVTHAAPSPAIDAGARGGGGVDRCAVRGAGTRGRGERQTLGGYTAN